MESLMKRAAEMDKTKPIGEYLISHSKRYLIRGVFTYLLVNTIRVVPRVQTRLLMEAGFFSYNNFIYNKELY